MAQTRRASRLTAGLASLGLCLTLFTALLWHVTSLPSERGVDRVHNHFGTWLGRTLYRISAEFELFFHAGQSRLAGRFNASPGFRFEPSKSQPFDPAARLGIDVTGLREALVLYKAGHLTQGDLAAQTPKDPIVRTTLAWVALQVPPRDTGYARMHAFLEAHPGWPARDAIERRMEAALYFNHANTAEIESQFSDMAPETLPGRLALARAFVSAGDTSDAQRLIREVWDRAPLTPPLENKVKTEFAAYISKADDKARADYLLYKDDSGAGLRAAALAGPDILALAKLRVAASNNRASDKMFAAVPKSMRNDPAYLFAKIQKLRHADKIEEAAALMLKAPRDPALLVNGDEWWLERRAIARKLLDLNEPQLAYRLCAESSPQSDEDRIEAEFHAGWIALRFLHDPASAAKHFAIAGLYAKTPISIARTAYWQGRAAEASKDPATVAQAKEFYEEAAAQSATYYGQLARERLGLTTIALRGVAPIAVGNERDDSIRVIELLYALGEKEYAFPLAVAAAKNLTSESQIGALAKIIAAQHDAHSSLIIGKILAQRRIAIDSLAFPTYGVPNFDPVENSAPPAIVYAIARQESAFDSHAVSSAGAKGLMQMITATAKNTAKHAGLDFDPAKLVTDAAFNAKLGAAHLGTLLAEEKGCPILVFAAYNAGGGRVKQWIAAYGDPRLPGVDPIDWVERIPFAETRNYVQRVMENLSMYRVSFGETTRQMPHEARSDAKL
ncbi:lytic transglycosylase domain-containing protein [Methylovirgula sp. HY1]|uniref:lytic transglycosylase domain-containing protein n=1 Tax=Methylovirgula sp. HY1 TaxID=2822761 RepID=UPI001C5BF97D|nr:lytic transglycosylase domain-containing protein [Methylovirgula sp. HY1]QXX73582.1 Soluble lytic murein transglycosylase [Methylovirgula sp. HY1]